MKRNVELKKGNVTRNPGLLPSKNYKLRKPKTHFQMPVGYSELLLKLMQRIGMWEPIDGLYPCMTGKRITG